MMKLEKPISVWCGLFIALNCFAQSQLSENISGSQESSNALPCKLAERDFKVDFDVCNPFNVILSNVTVGANVYSWSFGDGHNDSAKNETQHIYATEGVYQVRMITKSKGGCLDTTYKKFLLNIDSGTIFKNRLLSACKNKNFQLEGDAQSFKNCWWPDSGLNRTDIYNPTVRTDTERWYHNINFKYKGNAIKNPNFGGGNNSFSSGHLYDSTINTSGYYFVGPLPKKWNSSYENCYTEIDTLFQGDTMMIINGSTQPGTIVWKQTFEVTPNTNYVFGVFGRSLTANDSVHLVYNINNGEVLGSKIISNGVCSRTRLSSTWYSDMATKITLTITNKNTDSSMNNFALDSFAFRPLYINYDTIKVVLEKPPVFGISIDTSVVCYGDSVYLSASGGNKYEWSPTADIANPSAASTAAMVKENTTFQVIITESKCDFKDTLSVSAYAKPLPVVSLRKSNDVTCDNPRSFLTAVGGLTYNWAPQQYLNDPFASNPIASPKESTTFTCIAAGGNGCVLKDSIKVEVKKENKLPFLIPNAFSPNGDGLNDCFGLQQRGVLNDMTLTIYNRFGGKVFETKDPNRCWDGRLNGVMQETGTFAYIIQLDGACGKEMFKGTLILLR
jgi:gliding motility-associated-like protein